MRIVVKGLGDDFEAEFDRIPALMENIRLPRSRNNAGGTAIARVIGVEWKECEPCRRVPVFEATILIALL